MVLRNNGSCGPSGYLCELDKCCLESHKRRIKQPACWLNHPRKGGGEGGEERYVQQGQVAQFVLEASSSADRESAPEGGRDGRNVEGKRENTRRRGSVWVSSFMGCILGNISLLSASLPSLKQPHSPALCSLVVSIL